MNALKELVREALEAAAKAQELCEDAISDISLLSDEDYELLTADDPDLHTELMKAEDIAHALAEILG